MFTLSVYEGFCPACGKDLDQLGSVKVNNVDCFVNGDNVLAQNEDAELILPDPQPQITCAYCFSSLFFETRKE